MTSPTQPGQHGESQPETAVPAQGSTPHGSTTHLSTTHGSTTRRAMLTGAAGTVGAVIGGSAMWAARRRRSDGGEPAESATGRVPPEGGTQPGVVRPTTPQAFGLLVVGDVADPADLAFLTGLGERISELITAPPADVLPDGPMGLTITVGLGPRLVAARVPGGPGSEALPEFAGDDAIHPSARGGDLLLALYAADPTILGPVADRLTRSVPGYEPRWSQSCFRGPPCAGPGTIVRNPLGFHDSVQVPRTEAELAADVWIDGDLAGATIMVVRRLRLDLRRFHSLPPHRREEVIGRHLDGSPLSGGKPFDPVDVVAKAADGTYLTPARAHVRAAHPSFTGSRLMLRRSYAYDNGGDDIGLLFMSFQRELRSFVVTQRRLDDLDDLMTFASPTASATFLILPGQTPDRPLGTGLR